MVPSTLDVVTVSQNQDKQIQIFISYASDDDAIPPDAPGAKGFVTALHAYLEYAFQYHGYPRPSVWRGTRNVENGEELDPVVKEAIDASSLLLIILSRNWPHRRYCRRELEFFRQRWQADGDNIRHRIIVARKHYVEESEHPTLFDPTTGLIPRQTGFDFFKFDGRAEPGKERLYFDPQKRPQDSDYVQRASELGRHLWLVARNCMQKDNSQVVAAAQESKIRPQVPRNGRTIYLAKPAPDMLQAYRRVERELYEAGFDVVPRENQEIPLDQSAKEFIDEALQAAEVSVHLVGSDLGIHDRIVRLQLEGAAAKVERCSNERTGRTTGFHRIIWAPRFFTGEFRDPLVGFAKLRGQVDGDKVIDGDNPSQFEDFLRDHLGRNTPETGTPRGSEDSGPTVANEDAGPIGEKKIYLYHSEEDSEYAADLAMALQRENSQIEALLPALEGPPPEVESYHRQRLAECDAVVLCWANASEVWIRAHAHQLRDWRGLGRTERFAFRGLIAGPPPGNRKKILLRVAPRSEIDKVLDLTEQAPSSPGMLNDWFIRAPPNNP
jgi:hypothetical protein